MVTVASFVDTGDTTNIGYSRQYFNIGEVDPLPYWVSERFEPLYLKYLFSNYPYRELASTAGIGTYPFQQYGVSTSFTGIIARSDTGKAAVFYSGDAHEELFTEDDVGKTIPVYFAPPPTGTWIQRHANRSKKRVLCRGRSLGGSRC